MTQSTANSFAQILKWAVVLILGLAGSYVMYTTSSQLENLFGSGSAEVTTLQRQLDRQAMEMKELRNGILQSQVSMVDRIADLDSKLSQSMGAAVKDARVATIGTAAVKLEVQRQLKAASDHTYKGTKTDDSNEQYYKEITLPTKSGPLPVAWVIFYPNRPEGQRWKTGNWPIEFEVEVVRSQLQSGGYQNLVGAQARNEANRESRGKTYRLAVTKSKFEEVLVQNKRFYWWNPVLAMGGYYGWEWDSGTGSTTGSTSTGFGLGISFMGYGRTKADLSWRFLGIWGLFADDRARLGFEPFAWNLGEPVPLLTNLWVSPLITYDFERGSLGASGLISVKF